MPRDGSGVYSAPAGTTATPNTTIESSKYNALVADLVADANAARPVTAGGTGETAARLKDGTWRFQNTSDTTKLLALDLSGLTTATTRTQKAPNYDGTLSSQAKGTAIASAATTDIGAATGSMVHITGTTTITALGTADAGIEKTVVFDGALTLTHNATSLILFSGVNITTYAGLVMVFVSEGSGNWRELSQTEARGTWTPSVTFGVPGNLVVTYSARQGVWRKLGKVVQLEWEIVTGTFTHTTASSGVLITGQPFTAASPTGTFQWIGTLAFQGITKAGYTQFTSRIAATGTSVLILASASGSGDSTVQASDMPTGGSVILRGALTFEATT